MDVIFVFVDKNSEIDREEFKKVMGLMRKQNRQGAHHRDGRRFGMKVSVENGGLVEYFFGEDGKGSLHHDKFVQFLRQLHEEVCHSSQYQFFKYLNSLELKDTIVQPIKQNLFKFRTVPIQIQVRYFFLYSTL